MTEVFRYSQFGVDAAPYSMAVVKETPKTLIVKHVNGVYIWRPETLMKSDQGRTWFATERDAREAKRVQLEKRVHQVKFELQQLRSAIGEIEGWLERDVQRVKVAE